MTFDELMATTQRLNASTEALAAVAAVLRLRSEPIEAPPEVDARLREVVQALGLDGIDDLGAEQCQMVLGAIRAFFRQAGELIDAPDRPAGWLTDDPSVLQSQGRASMMVATLLGEIAPRMGDLHQRLVEGEPRLLDLGTGTGWLAIALAQAYPRAHVVGIDIAEAPLALARENAAASPAADRIELRLGDAAALDDDSIYDLVWVPGPFLSRDLVVPIVAVSHRALAPGGWVVFGRYAGPPDPLAATLVDLRVVRSGGHPWTTAEAEALLVDAGFTDVHTPERTWAAPMIFTVGQRP